MTDSSSPTTAVQQVEVLQLALLGGQRHPLGTAGAFAMAGWEHPSKGNQIHQCGTLMTMSFQFLFREYLSSEVE